MNQTFFSENCPLFYAYVCSTLMHIFGTVSLKCQECEFIFSLFPFSFFSKDPFCDVEPSTLISAVRTGGRG